MNRQAHNPQGWDFLITLLIFIFVLTLIGLVGAVTQKPAAAPESVPVLVPLAALPTVIATTAVPATTATAVPAPTQTAPPVALVPVPLTHVVAVGETLFSIALFYDIPLAELAAANGIADPNQIIVGQVLTLPGQLLAAAAAPATAETGVAAVVITATRAAPTVTPVPPTTVNGLPYASFIVLPPGASDHIRDVYRQGQGQGNNPHAYSKVGDSTIQVNFMVGFDEGGVNLADYGYLQPVADYFQGSHGRDGLAVRVGLHSWTATDPAWANKAICGPNETPVACEIRVHRPSFIFIRLGSNDRGVPGSFDQNIRQIVELSLAKGVIPILGTKADRFEGSNINNEILRQIAVDYQVPLWDFDLVAQTIPGRGLGSDFVHMNAPLIYDYNQVATFQTGHGAHSLTALIMLHILLLQVQPSAILAQR